jgi:hypothetical protein
MTYNDGNTQKELIAADVRGFISKTWGAALIFFACAWEKELMLGVNLSLHEYQHALADRNGVGSMYISRDQRTHKIVGASYDTIGIRTDKIRKIIATAPGENMSGDDNEIEKKLL